MQNRTKSRTSAVILLLISAAVFSLVVVLLLDKPIETAVLAESIAEKIVESRAVEADALRSVVQTALRSHESRKTFLLVLLLLVGGICNLFAFYLSQFERTVENKPESEPSKTTV